MKLLTTLNDGNGVVLTGEEMERVRSSIFTMLWMTGDDNWQNRLIDGTTGNTIEESPRILWEQVDKVDYGYIVYTGSAESLEAQLNFKDEDEHGIAITVLMLDPDGTSAATFDLITGEIKLLSGTVKSFLDVSDGYVQAW